MSDEVLGTVRASAWPGLFDCAYKFYCENVLGMWKPSSSAAHLGTSIHASTAAFDKAVMEHNDITIDDAAGVFVDTLRNPESEVDWSDGNINQAEIIGLRLHTRYCADISPTHKYSAVELLCDEMDIGTEYGIIKIKGTTDRIRILADGTEGISDLKSGKASVGADGKAVTKGHHLQLGIYTILAEYNKGYDLKAPAEIIGLQTTNTGGVGVGEVIDVKTPLIGTSEEPGLIVMAAQIFKTGMFMPNPKSMLCNPLYCAAWDKCRYHN